MVDSSTEPLHLVIPTRLVSASKAMLPNAMTTLGLTVFISSPSSLIYSYPSGDIVQRLLSDNQLAKDRLDWEPQISLTDGLQQTINWVSDHLMNFLPGEYQV